MEGVLGVTGTARACRRLRCPGVGLVLREQPQKLRPRGPHCQAMATQRGVVGDDLVADPSEHGAFADRDGIPGPRVAEPGRRHQVEGRRVRSVVRRPESHDDLVGSRLRVHHLDIEEALVVEDAGVEQLIFRGVAVAPGILRNEVGVGKGSLRIEVGGPKEGRRREGVLVEVEFLDVLAVVALRVGEAEQALLEDRVALVPQAQGQTEPLLVVGDAEQAVLVPAVGPPAGIVVGERAPRVAVGRVVLADGAPRPLGEVGAPAPPGLPGTRRDEAPALRPVDRRRRSTPPRGVTRARAPRSAHRIFVALAASSVPSTRQEVSRLALSRTIASPRWRISRTRSSTRR